MKMIIIIGICMLMVGCQTQLMCDIGEVDVAGDYILTDTEFNEVPSTVFQNQKCAIQDCVAFNQVHNESRCMV